VSRGKKESPELLRLWGDVWERWRWPDGVTGEAEWVDSVEREPSASGDPATLALPARLVVAVPLWIDSAEAEIVEETAKLELEVRGLLGKRQTASDAVLRTLDQRGGRTLVLAAVFPAVLPESMPPASFDRYEASPFLRPLRADALTLWREGPDLVAAVTRGGKLLYWEAIGGTDDAREISGWLNLVCLQLRAEGVLDGGIELVNELAGYKEGVLRLPPGVDGTAKAPGEVKPTLDAAIFRWRPVAAVAAAVAAGRARQVRQIALAAAAAYAGIVLIVGLYVGWQRLEIAGLAGRADELKAQVATFQPVADRWERIGATTETEFYPLEILHHVVLHLPSEGVQLTAFTVEGRQVLVKGDANPQRLVTPFFDALRDDPELTGVRWEMGTPELRPDGSARFQIQGAFDLL
jgi:hypothetical protein